MEKGDKGMGTAAEIIRFNEVLEDGGVPLLGCAMGIVT